jgi:hypothetical protein
MGNHRTPCQPIEVFPPVLEGKQVGAPFLHFRTVDRSHASGLTSRVQRAQQANHGAEFLSQVQSMALPFQFTA